MRLLILILLILSQNIEARDRGEVRLFRRSHPCPATQRTVGACPGFVVDHVIPLCAGGPDRIENLQWQPRAQASEKDKIEIAFCRCMARDLVACK